MSKIGNMATVGFKGLIRFHTHA